MIHSKIELLFKEGTHLPLIEKFYTIQGEGYNVGKAAFFIRIGGCDIGCKWCDSKYSWKYGINSLVKTEELATEIIKSGYKNVVVTGGEPLMYNLDIFTKLLKKNNIKTYLETSGTHNLSGVWDWISLSPKPHQPPKDIFFEIANELKVIIYDIPSDLEWAEINSKKVKDKTYLYLQPEWSRKEINTPKIADYIMKNTKWTLSVQLHKYIGLP